MENNKKKWLPLMILFLVILVSIILIYPKFNKMSDDGFFGLRSVTFQVEILDHSEEIFNSIQLDDTIVSQDRLQDGKITGKEQDEFSTIVSLTGTANYRGPFMTLGGQTLKVGKDFFIKTEMIELQGRVIGLEYGGQND